MSKKNKGLIIFLIILIIGGVYLYKKEYVGWLIYKDSPYLAQSFIASTSNLGTITVEMAIKGSVSEPIKVSLRSSLDGNDLTSTTIFGLTTIRTTKQINLNYQLSVGNKYYLMFYYNGGDINNGYVVWHDFDYVQGEINYYNNGWKTIDNMDLLYSISSNCITNAFFDCVDNKLYWYDSCGNKGDLKEDCMDKRCNRDAGCIPIIHHHSYLCYDGNIWWYDNFANKEEVKETCPNGCRLSTNSCNCVGESQKQCYIGDCIGTQERKCNNGIWGNWLECEKDDDNCGSDTICSNDCTSGSKQCSGAGYQTCGNYDTDTCTEWNPIVTPCSSGQTCSGGVCSGGNGCSDTCSSKGFECGTQTICGTSNNCGTCATGSCSNGKCVVTCPSGTIKCPDGTCKADCVTIGCSSQSDCKSDQICEKSKCLTCEIYQSPKDNKCQMAMWVWIVAGVFGFMMIMMMMKK